MILDPIATPDISQNDVYIVDSTIPVTNLLGGHPDDLRYFVFANDSIFESNTDIKLQAGVNFQGKVGDTLVLLYDGAEWLEMSRSLNPLYAGGSLNDYTLDSGYILTEINNLKNQVSSIQQQLDIIGATSVNTVVNFDPSMSSDEMQSLINDVKPNLTNGITVQFKFSNGIYTINKPLDFCNFNGYGSVDITAPSWTPNATESLNVTLDSHIIESPIFRFFDCSCEMNVNGIAGYYKIPVVPSNIDYHSGILVINSSNVNINQSFIYSDDVNGSGIYYKNSTGKIQYSYVNMGRNGIVSTDMSRISINECYANLSNKPLYGILSLQGSEINLWDGNYPQGQTDDTTTENGGRIYS